MNKSDIVTAVAQSTGESVAATKRVVDATFDEITSAIARGEPIKVNGLGTFDVKATKARVGRNPRTGDQVDIPAGRKIVFKASSDLKSRI